VGKHSQTFNIFALGFIQSSEELHHRDLQIVASQIEESDVDGVGVVASDGEVYGCCGVFIDDSQSAEICDIGCIHEGHPGLEAPMRRNGQDRVLDVGIGLRAAELLDVLHDHADQLFERDGVFSLSEEVSSVFEAVALEGRGIEGLDEFVEVEVGGFGFFEALRVSIVLEVTHPFQETDLNIATYTPLWLFREEREFSTITRFLPGEMREAFQNSVPRSIPMTCEAAVATKRRMRTCWRTFMRKLYLLIHTYKFR